MNGNNYARGPFKRAVHAGGLNGVTWHTLRHTFASRLAMSGATERDLMELGRWKDPRMVRRYAHLSPAHTRGMIARLSEFAPNRDKNRDKTAVGEAVGFDGTQQS